MPPLGFELTISAGELPQTYALDRAATGTGITHESTLKKFSKIDIKHTKIQPSSISNAFYTYFTSAGYPLYGASLRNRRHDLF